MIHSPGFRVRAWAASRRMNSCFDFAGRRSTLASWKPPSVKCTCASPKPGATKAPAKTWVRSPTSAAAPALSPT